MYHLTADSEVVFFLSTREQNAKEPSGEKMVKLHFPMVLSSM